MTELNDLIRRMKSDSYHPELKYVYVRGIYTPDLSLIRSGALSRIYGVRVRLDGKDVPCFCGVAVILIPKLLLESAKKYTEEREVNSLNLLKEGIIAHELSHFVLENSVTEHDISEDVTRRGYGEQMEYLYKLYELAGLPVELIKRK